MKSTIKSSKGAALAVLIIIFAVIAIVGTTVLTISLYQTKLSVASEDTTAAYYYARSAVEIISSNIEDKYDKLDDLRAIVDALPETASEEDANKAINDYNIALAAFKDLKIIPAAPSETCRVNVSGILPDPLTVEVNLVNTGGTDTIELSCTATYEGYTSSARAQIGTFTDESINVPIQSEVEFNVGDLGKDTVFSWGDIHIQGSNIKMNDYGTQKATMSAQGKFITNNGKTPEGDFFNLTPVTREMPVLVPPTTLPSHSTTLLSGTQSLGPGDSGYYGPLYTYKNGKIKYVSIDWTVDTSGGDVVLIFDGMLTANDTNITVSGPNDLFIYIREPYNGDEKVTTRRTLLDLANTTEIKSPDGIPHTYFIVYNDIVQKKQAELDTTLLPASTAKTISADRANLDTINISNNSKAISAYFYAPGCLLNVENLSAIDGAIYGSEINVQGNKTFNYVPFDFAGMINSAGEDIDGVIVNGFVTFPYVESVYKRVWVR